MQTNAFKQVLTFARERERERERDYTKRKKIYKGESLNVWERISESKIIWTNG